MRNWKNTSKIYVVLTAVIISIFGVCPRTIGGANTEHQKVDDTILESYRQYGIYTDPGEYASLYRDLPESLVELCALIKAQLIHPFVDLPEYEHLIPEDRHDEDAKYPTVKALLAGLLEHDSRGLIADRKPEHRLVVTCRYHAILLASILKSRGIPVRVRYGFASYIAPGLHIYHVICEVWNDEENRWMLVDADPKMVDFPREQFEFANDVWLKYQKGEIYPGTYITPDSWGAHVILDVLCHDFVAVQGTEHLYWERPPIAQDEQMDVKRLTGDQVEILERIAGLLYAPEKHLQELQLIYKTYQFLQFQ